MALKCSGMVPSGPGIHIPRMNGFTHLVPLQPSLNWPTRPDLCPSHDVRPAPPVGQWPRFRGSAPLSRHHRELDSKAYNSHRDLAVLGGSFSFRGSPAGCTCTKSGGCMRQSDLFGLRRSTMSLLVLIGSSPTNSSLAYMVCMCI